MAHPDAAEKARQRRRAARLERRRSRRARTLLERKKSTGSVRLAESNPRPPTRQEKASRSLFKDIARRLGVTVGNRKGKRFPAVRFPTTFSFIEEPDEAIATLRRLATACWRARRMRINLNQEKCELVDYGAESIALVIAHTARHGLNTKFDGTYPSNEEQREIALSTGLSAGLGFSGYDPDRFKMFELMQGRSNEKGKKHLTSHRSYLSDKFARYIDECLSRFKLQLGHDRTEAILGLISEVIGNAEEHSGTQDWWIGGYQRINDDDWGDCHLTIFNFGTTIAENMKSLPKESRLRKQIQRLTDRHVRSGFFGTQFTEEELWTLYAVQGGVSSLQTAAEGDDDPNIDRGQGLADMVEWFQDLGETVEPDANPVLCVISGNSYIRFDENSKMSEERITDDGDERRIIAFNARNNLNDAPNKGNVKRLASYFPGTVISLRFYLDRRRLDQLASGEPYEDDRDHQLRPVQVR